MVLMPSCAAVSLGLHSPRSGTVPSWQVNADRPDEDEPTQATRRAGDTQPNIGQRKRVLFAVSSGPAVGAGAAVPRPYDAPPPAPRCISGFSAQPTTTSGTGRLSARVRAAGRGQGQARNGGAWRPLRAVRGVQVSGAARSKGAHRSKGARVSIRTCSLRCSESCTPCRNASRSFSSCVTCHVSPSSSRPRAAGSCTSLEWDRGRFCTLSCACELHRDVLGTFIWRDFSAPSTACEVLDGGGF